MKRIAIIPAAGIGVRMGINTPKQFLLIKDIPVLAITLGVFERSDYIDRIILVAPRDEIKRCKEIVEKYRINKIYDIVPGGERRQDSVRNGLYSAKSIADESDIVLIHDGVRPFIKEDLIKRLIDEARSERAIAVGIPAKDTVKMVDEKGYVLTTIERNKIWLIQTPQVFRFKDIYDAHVRAHIEGWEGITDDSMLLEKMGIKVKVIKGYEENIKITTPFDLKLADAILQIKTRKN